MTYTLLGATAGTGILGFLAGLFSFKVKVQWCPGCGSRLRCVDCHEPAVERQTAQLSSSHT